MVCLLSPIQDINTNLFLGIVQVTDGKATKLADFTALKSQLAKATPTNTAMAAYKITNTAPAACPATGTAWRASEKLPPVVNPDLCSCMVKSLSCTVADNLSGEEIGDLFGTVCGLDSKSCAGVARNPNTGVYGAYSMCTGEQQLSFVVDQYYKNQKKAADACDFKGKAKVQTPASSDGSCTNLVKAAGTAGTGTVTAQASAASGAGGASGTGSSTSGTATSSKSGNSASGVVVPAFSIGMLQMGLYVLVAAFTGAGMIML